LTPKKNF